MEKKVHLFLRTQQHAKPEPESGLALFSGGESMAISLFPHNASAYEAALAMLAETGKAAIIHPTGTGKSFIGLRLCEDHTDKRVCWLSPSEYIFKTQLENLAAAGAAVPENIVFFTYAKLMLLDDAELREIRPDFIILDEFHRCGADQWGAGVRRLLALYRDAKLLGLSATSIRYLDRQRDMADELFDGNVASEMTLGEAIVRGILKAPTYVLSVFAYQKDYERLKNRAMRSRNAAVREEAGKYLDALRRALDRADGLDLIFDRHMTDRHGKYLVFCANLEHMREMMGHVQEWFGRIDPSPHVYSAYSNDPASSRAFRDFKADRSSHLKLLFCIDMLNEGVHVEDVSGVVLFRPTVSPIIYKQQIGRALSASKATEPIIFDIVNNIDNLYSIGAIKREMDQAVSHYLFSGDGGRIVNERFHLIEEVRDARELFERLNDTLTVSWELMYDHARQYYELNGNLNIPRKYRTAEGYALGAWLQTQRRIYAGEQYGNLDDERIAKLNAIGILWRKPDPWEFRYSLAEAYYREHGDLNIPSRFRAEGVWLGKWLSEQRQIISGSLPGKTLTADRIRRLEAIGLDRTSRIERLRSSAWERQYRDAEAYYREHGDLNIPQTYLSPSGSTTGVWVCRQRKYRREGKLPEKLISLLDAIGMIWEFDDPWENGYRHAALYFGQTGGLSVPFDHVCDDGFALGIWIANQRANHNHPTEYHALTAGQTERLEKLGMVWRPADAQWQTGYAHAESYLGSLGEKPWKRSFVSEDGYKTGEWIRNQLRSLRQGGMRPERVEALARLGLIDNSSSSLSLPVHIAAAAETYRDTAHAARKRYTAAAGRGGVGAQRSPSPSKHSQEGV